MAPDPPALNLPKIPVGEGKYWKVAPGLPDDTPDPPMDRINRALAERVEQRGGWLGADADNAAKLDDDYIRKNAAARAAPKARQAGLPYTDLRRGFTLRVARRVWLDELESIRRPAPLVAGKATTVKIALGAMRGKEAASGTLGAKDAPVALDDDDDDEGMGTGPASGVPAPVTPAAKTKPEAVPGAKDSPITLDSPPESYKPVKPPPSAATMAALAPAVKRPVSLAGGKRRRSSEGEPEPRKKLPIMIRPPGRYSQ